MDYYCDFQIFWYILGFFIILSIVSCVIVYRVLSKFYNKDEWDVVLAESIRNSEKKYNTYHKNNPSVVFRRTNENANTDLKEYKYSPKEITRHAFPRARPLVI